MITWSLVKAELRWVMVGWREEAAPQGRWGEPLSIRRQYSGHVICIGQSEASITCQAVTFSPVWVSTSRLATSPIC